MLKWMDNMNRLKPSVSIMLAGFSFLQIKFFRVPSGTIPRGIGEKGPKLCKSARSAPTKKNDCSMLITKGVARFSAGFF